MQGTSWQIWAEVRSRFMLVNVLDSLLFWVPSETTSTDRLPSGSTACDFTKKGQSTTFLPNVTGAMMTRPANTPIKSHRSLSSMSKVPTDSSRPLASPPAFAISRPLLTLSSPFSMRPLCSLCASLLLRRDFSPLTSALLSAGSGSSAARLISWHGSRVPPIPP